MDNFILEWNPCALLIGIKISAITLENGHLLWGKANLFHQASSFRRDAHGLVRGEEDTSLASQISGLNPDDQRGDRYRSQMALTSFFINIWSSPIIPEFSSKNPWNLLSAESNGGVICYINEVTFEAHLKIG